MSISVAIDGVSILDGIPPASIQASSAANGGEAAFGGFDVEDPNGTLTITAHRRVTITESDCSQPRLFTGWITERGIKRDKQRGQIVSAQRVHDVTTVDLNALFAFRPISGTDGNRPAETWNERLAWLLGSSWLSGLIENDTTYVLSITRPMDAADYRDQPPSAVLNDLIDRSTYPMTYFAFYDPSDGKIKLYFNRISATDLTSTLTISNVKSELSATCFEPDSEAVLTRAPDQTYSEVVVEYSHGTKRLFRSRASTAAAYVRRGTKILRPYTGGLATATTQAENFLDTHATEEDRISVTITVPPASAGLVWAGQRILVQFTHLPGYTTYTSMRVVSCTATPTDGTVQRYAIALELVAPRATGSGAPCSGDITLVQSVSVGGDDITMSNPQPITLGSTPTVGNLLIMIIYARVVLAYEEDPVVHAVDPVGFTAIKEVYLSPGTDQPRAKYIGAFYRIVEEGDGATWAARQSENSTVLAWGTSGLVLLREYSGVRVDAGTPVTYYTPAIDTPPAIIPAYTPVAAANAWLMAPVHWQPGSALAQVGGDATYDLSFDSGDPGLGNRHRMALWSVLVADPSGSYGATIGSAVVYSNAMQFALAPCEADTTVDLGQQDWTWLPGFTVTGEPTVGATIMVTSPTTAQWATGGHVTIYWPMLTLCNQIA